MRILFEEHQYEVTEEIQNTLKDVASLQDVEKKISVSYVGYFYNSTVKDCVFILPKVLLKDKAIEVDGKKKTIEILADLEPKDKSERDYVTPEDIITREGQEKYLTKEYKKFIYEFAVWIYRSLCVYRKSHQKSKAIYFKELPQSGKSKRHEANTYLDILLSLIRFNQENQNFFMFTIRNLHSGMNKINWTKTISKSQAFMTDGGAPIYLDPVNKKRKINFDEELFIIFFSILNYINKKYGFKAPINFQYELINDRRFEYYLTGYGANRLRQIKYKYFSDRALILWDLCYAFFDSAHKLAVNTDQREYLLAKKFEVVFEAMIDNLIGDDNIPKGLKEQDDGKRVDHMYSYDALTRNDEDTTDEQIYYIGDSKYYKSGNKLGRESIYKQYTYARNVIQWNIDLFLNEDFATRDMSDEERADYKSDKSTFESIRLRKDSEHGELTEGYNVIPNFFLSAFVNPDRKYVAADNIVGHKYKAKVGEKADAKGYAIDGSGKYKPQTHLTYQFENRLFDRDTLILSHYDVNFLYVLYLYARQHSSEKDAWKRKVRRLFRDEIRKVLEEKYDFYAMKPKMSDESCQSFIKDHFKELNGRIYKPYDEADVYSLALEKVEGENSVSSPLYIMLTDYFEIEPVKSLGTYPKDTLQQKVDTYKFTYGEKPYFGADKPNTYIADKASLIKFDAFIQSNILAVGSGRGNSALEYVVKLQGLSYIVVWDRQTNDASCYELQGPLNMMLRDEAKKHTHTSNSDFYVAYKIGKKINASFNYGAIDEKCLDLFCQLSDITDERL